MAPDPSKAPTTTVATPPVAEQPEEPSFIQHALLTQIPKMVSTLALPLPRCRCLGVFVAGCQYLGVYVPGYRCLDAVCLAGCQCLGVFVPGCRCRMSAWLDVTAWVSSSLGVGASDMHSRCSVGAPLDTILTRPCRSGLVSGILYRHTPCHCCSSPSTPNRSPKQHLPLHPVQMRQSRCPG